ncbi:MAG: sulfite exporter TauE/SafE family protein, partial [Candidatus Limnocylindria bacterium]
MTDAAFTVGLGFALGFVIGLTGVGGGALVAPALYILLGLSFAQAVGLSLVYSVFTKVVGLLQHRRQGTVHWRLTLLYGSAGIPGALLGSWALYATRGAETFFALLMSAVLGAVAILLLLEANAGALAGRRRPLDTDRLG